MGLGGIGIPVCAVSRPGTQAPHPGGRGGGPSCCRSSSPTSCWPPRAAARGPPGAALRRGGRCGRSEAFVGPVAGPSARLMAWGGGVAGNDCWGASQLNLVPGRGRPRVRVRKEMIGRQGSFKSDLKSAVAGMHLHSAAPRPPQGSGRAEWLKLSVQPLMSQRFCRPAVDMFCP